MIPALFFSPPENRVLTVLVSTFVSPPPFPTVHLVVLPVRLALAGASLSTLAQQVHDQLVGGQHDGRVGDLSDELRDQSSVKSSVALLHCHQPRRLEEVPVFAALFSESGPDHLVRVGYAGGAAFGEGGGHHEPEEVRRPPVSLAAGLGVAAFRQAFLQALVDEEADHGLGDAGVRGRQAAVEAASALSPVNVARALQRVHPLLSSRLSF